MWEWKILSIGQSGSISEITNWDLRVFLYRFLTFHLGQFHWGLKPVDASIPPSLCLFLLSLSFKIQLTFHDLRCHPVPWQYLKVPCSVTLASYQAGKTLMRITPTNHTPCTGTLVFRNLTLPAILLSVIFFPSLSLHTFSFPTAFPQDSPNKRMKPALNPWLLPATAFSPSSFPC